MSGKKRKGSNGDYEVGFRKTPIHTRFKKGSSGNPGGRPPRKKHPQAETSPLQSDLDDLLRAELDRVITVTENGKPKKLTARELVARSQVNTAIKGNSNAQKHVIAAIRELEQRDAERAALELQMEAEQRERDRQTYLYIADWKAKRELEWAAAEALGDEPHNPWPHPDDILLFPKTQRWHVRGPFDETDLAFFKWRRAERDYLFAYGTLQDRERETPNDSWSKLYTMLWICHDVSLPLRWQLVPRLEEAYWELNLMPIAKLEALVKERREYSSQLKIFAGISSDWDKDSYKTVNTIMKPLLKRQGYRSLKEFEHAFECFGEDMPWPRTTSG